MDLAHLSWPSWPPENIPFTDIYGFDECQQLSIKTAPFIDVGFLNFDKRFLKVPIIMSYDCLKNIKCNFAINWKPDETLTPFFIEDNPFSKILAEKKRGI